MKTMPVKPDREYRNFSIERRVKEEGEPSSFLVQGYASTFDEYELFQDKEMILTERIDARAFDEADMSDVVFLLDHTGRVYARTKNDTVKLSIDDKGLYTETDLSKTTAARQVYEDIEAGNYSQMSFAFTVAEDHFDEDLKAEDGRPILRRIIDRVKKVYDISAVGFPANPNTDISAATRAAFDGEIARREAERLKEQKARQERAKKEVELKLKLWEVEHD
jgi:HK97 family phage prohead protease